MAQPQAAEISIIIPVYNEAETLPDCFDRLIPILESITAKWEIICVDDGSRDGSAEVIRAAHGADSRVKLLSFSRNFGKEVALTAGLDFAAGLAVIPLDADLQDPPELIPEMVAKWQEGYDVVLATRQFRSGDSWAKRFWAEWFYRVIHKLSDVKIPKNTGDFRLMDARVVESVRQLNERTRFMKGILAWVGYNTTQIYYDRPERMAGESKFRFRSLWRLALDGIFSFTTVPLKVWTYIGALISFLAFSYALILVIRALVSGVDVPGYTSLMVVTLFMGGIQLISLGVVGEYVGRIYRETKQRPLYILQEKRGF